MMRQSSFLFNSCSYNDTIIVNIKLSWSSVFRAAGIKFQMVVHVNDGYMQTAKAAT